jgi:hypothetical protein
VIAVFSFIALMGASGLTVVGVYITEERSQSEGAGFMRAGVGDFEVDLVFFRPPWEPPPEPVDLEAFRDQLVAQRGEEAPDIPPLADLIAQGGPVVEFATTIMRDPQSVERQIGLALSQAVLSMVVAFAILNLLLHPRAPIITHVIHALYFHAALLPYTALAAIVSVTIALAWDWAGAGVGIAALLAALVFAGWSDRSVYASSLFGAILRTTVLFLGYLLTFVGVTITLSWSLIG